MGEGADGTMGGSSGDGVWILNSIIKNKLESEKSAVVVVDKKAVEKSIKKGLNKYITLNVGGSLNPKYNKTLKVTGNVKLLLMEIN